MGLILGTAVKLRNKLNIDFGLNNVTEDKAMNIPELKIRCFTVGHKHNDKTPALSIKDSRSIFKCFACGISGTNSLEFLMHYNWHLFSKIMTIKGNFDSKNFKKVLEQNNLTEEEYNYGEELIEKFQLEKSLKNLIEISQNEKISIDILKKDEMIINVSQYLYQEMYGEEFDVNSIFSQKYDMKEEIEAKQEILKEFYNFMKKELDNSPQVELKNYFETRNINEKTLKDRGILYLEDSKIPPMKKFMIEKFSKKVLTIEIEDFFEICLESSFIKNKDISYLENFYDRMKNNKLNDQEKEIVKTIKGIFYLQKYDFLNKYQDIPFKNNKVIMPFFRQPGFGEKERQVEGIQFRSLDPNVKKEFRFMGYGPLTIYNKDLLETSDTIIIFEGGTDANTAVQLGHPAISIPGAGSQLSKQELSLFLGKNIYILGDNDVSGVEFIENMSKVIGPIISNPDENNKVRQIKLPNNDVKDFNEWHSKFNKGNEDYLSDKISNIIQVTKTVPLELGIPTSNFNIALGINTTNDKFKMGKYEDVIKFIEDNNIKSFSVSDRNFLNLNKYLDYVEFKNKTITNPDDKLKCIPNLKINFGGLYDINLLFTKREDIQIVQSKILDNQITLKNLNNLPNTVTIVLPYSLNKILLKKNFITHSNVLIGVEPDIELDYLPNKWSFSPIFFNNNSFTNKSDYKSYILYKHIQSNQKLSYEEIENPQNLYEENKFIHSSKFIEFKSSRMKAKNRIDDEIKLKGIYSKILANTQRFNEKINIIKENVVLKEEPNLPNILVNEEKLNLLETKEEKMKFMSSAFRKLLLYLWDENVLNDKRFFEEPNIEHLIKNWKSPNIKKTISKEDLPLYMNRISQELEILASFENDNYFKYFVILKDITEFLKDKNYQISMGRGSAASSFVAYMMGLHQVDPIKHNLYFERFLNKNRKDYPDIDLNMSAEAKEELLKYLDVKYKGKTATVKVFNKIGKKGAIANTLRIVGYKTEEINNISKKIDEIAYDMENLEDMEDLNDLDNVQQDFDTIPEELEKIYEEKPLLRNLIEKQVGEVSNYILHPSAIFIDSEDFNYDVEYKDGMKVLNIDQNINKIKFDFLNSKNLAIVETAIKYLDKESQFVYSKDLDFENKEIWDNLLKINYIGIPELDSEKKVIRESKEKYLKQVEPRNIDELSDFLALIRPGALESKKEYLNNRKIEFLYTNKNENFKEVYFQYKTIFEKELNIKEWKELLKWREKSQNPQLEQLKSFLRQKLHNNYEEQNMIEDFIKNKVKYLSKNDLEKELESNEKYRQITKNTYGTIIYQEQIMEILNIMGGIPLDETNEIRKAISKKKTTEIAKFKEEIINTLSNSNKNLSKEAIEYLFNKIETSSKYAFNKSHSVAYAMNSYSFLYLKIKHYPVFYLAVKEHKPKLDLEINSKDSYKAIINYSKENYTIVKNRIVEPMKTVNLFKTNKAAMLEILEKQPFKNFTDMMNKVNRQVINKSVIKELMKVGYLYKGFFKESEETLNKIFGDETKKVLHECNLDLM